MGLFDFLRKKEDKPATFASPQPWEQQDFAGFMSEPDGAQTWPWIPEADTTLLAPDYHSAKLKECVRCYERKPLTGFYFQNKRTGALQSYCKSCTSALAKQSAAKKKAALADNLPPIFLPPVPVPASVRVAVESIPRIQEFLDEEPSVEQQLQDILDDLDVLTQRVAVLQAKNKPTVKKEMGPFNPPRIPGDRPVG